MAGKIDPSLRQPCDPYPALDTSDELVEVYTVTGADVEVFEIGAKLIKPFVRHWDPPSMIRSVAADIAGTAHEHIER